MTRCPAVAFAALLAILPLGVLTMQACARPMAPERKESLLEQGDDALLAGNLADAEKAFAEVLQADPNSARATFGLGLTRLRLGQTAKSLPLFEKAATLEPDNADHAFLRAHTLASLNRRDEAIEAFAKLTQAHPEHIQAQLESLGLLIDAGRLDEARKAAFAALSRFPRNFGLLVATGRILGMAGSHGESVEYYKRAREIRPYASQPVYGLVEAYRNTGKVAESLEMIKIFDQLKAREAELKQLQDEAARNPGDPAPSLRYLDRLFAEQRDDEAIEKTTGLLAQFPSLPGRSALALRAARAAARLGSRERARAYLDLAESEGTKTPDDLIALGEVHEFLGEFSEAMEVYDKCLQERPDLPAALLGMGRAALRDGKIELAEAPLRRAASLDPKSAPARALTGLLLVKKGEPRAAMDALRAAIALDPNDPDALFGLGFMAQQARDNKEAERLLRKALEIRPGDGSTLVVLALLLSERGECEEALPIFTRALEAQYRNMSLHASLIRCLEQTGRMAEAAEARKIANQISGQAPDAKTP